MNEKNQKTMPVILSIASSFGVVLTSYIVSRETLKNSETLKKVYSDKKNKKAIIKAFLKTYWPAIVSGSATIASIVAGSIISKKYEASLTATAIMLDQSYRKFKNKTKKLIGEEKTKEIIDELAKDDYKNVSKEVINGINVNERLYWEEHIGYFIATPENLAKAFALSSERLMYSDMYENGNHTNCWSSFRVLLEDAKAKIVKRDDYPVDDISYDYGWNYDYINEVYDGCMFLHYITEPVMDEEGTVLYYKIIIDKEPVFNTPYNPRNISGGYDVNQIDEFIDPKEEMISEYDSYEYKHNTNKEV